MYTPDLIRQLFGDDVLNYLTRKNRGGISAEKGNTYENYFAIYQIASLAKDVIEHSKDVYISSQILAFVDDLVIDCSSDPCRHYQLKNSSSVDWSNGSNPICDDFEKQYHLNHHLSRPSELFLVVSDSALSISLQGCIPSAIQAFSQVFHFPYAPDLVKVIFQQSAFLQALEYLCAFEQPDPDKVECVAKVLAGAWVTSGKSKIAVLEVLTTAQQSSPSYIRCFGQGWQLHPEVEEIFSQIEGFTYKLAKGFLHWEYEGILEGTPPYSIETDAFNNLQARIRQIKPTSFEQLEVLL